MGEGVTTTTRATTRRFTVGDVIESARADTRWAMFIGLAVLNLADVITTAMVLDRGGSERNPFVQPFVDNMWQVGLMKAAVLVLIGALLTRCRDSRIAEFSLAATTGWYLAVVMWNIAVLTIL